MAQKAFKAETKVPHPSADRSEPRWNPTEGELGGVAPWTTQGDRIRPPRGVGHGHQRPVRGSREMNKFFKALSDETRRNILRLLEDRDHSVNEIVGNFHLSQPTISRHLSVLKEANLVLDQRRGQHVVYQLNSPALADSARRFFGRFNDCAPDF